MAKPSIVFCSGAWHTEFHIRPCVPCFEKAGYDIIPSPLYSAGHETNTDETVDKIRDTVTAEMNTGRDVCLVLHSAAGLLGTEAVNRILASGPIDGAGRIAHIIYVGSFLNWPDLIKHLFENELMIVDVEKKRSFPLKPYEGFYNDMSPADAEAFVQALTYQASTEPQLSSEKWKEVKSRTMVVCEMDGCVPVGMQEREARENGMEVVRMKAGHCPFVTQPEKFVEVVDDILKT